MSIPDRGTCDTEQGGFALLVVGRDLIGKWVGVAMSGTTKNGVVDGTDADNVINEYLYEDGQGDRVSDQDDIVKAGGGDDVVSGGGGADIIHGGEGNDQLYGGQGAASGAMEYARETFQWSKLQDPDHYKHTVHDGTDLDGHSFTQTTGHVVVTLDVPHQSQSLTDSDFETEKVYTGGLSGVSSHSSLESSANCDDSHAVYELGFSDPVRDVRFNVTDIDSNKAQVKILAYDAAGNVLPVDLSGGSDIALFDLDGDGHAETAQGTDYSSKPHYSDNAITVSIAGPVARIEIVHENIGTGSSVINVTDVAFEAPTGQYLPSAADGNDAIYGDAGDDVIYGQDGDDILSGGDGDDVIYGGHGDLPAAPAIPGEREAFRWSELADPDGSKHGKIDDNDDMDGHVFTQNTGSVVVTVDIPRESQTRTDTNFETEKVNIDGIDGGDLSVDRYSSLESEADHRDSEAVYGMSFSDPVTDVNFRVTDIDGNRAQVQIRAYDVNGNLIPVHLTGGSDIALSDLDGDGHAETAHGTDSHSHPDDADNAILVEIAGPVARIEIEHENIGSGSSHINVTDVFFNAPSTSAPFGPDGDDVIDGGAGDDVLYGEDGNDTITGGTGADQIFGGDDRDVIYGGAGDVIDGGEGGDDYDRLIVDGPANVIYNANDPESGRVDFLGENGTVTGTLTFKNIENVEVNTALDGIVSGTSGDDVIDADYTGDLHGDRVDNNDAILSGEFGDDDIIRAGDGDDVILAGAGNDDVDGGAGDDRIVIGDGFGIDDVIGGEAGETNGDVLDGSALTQDAIVTFAEPERGGLKTVDGGATNRVHFDEIETVITGSGDDDITGSEGDDTLISGAGNDTVVGGAGDDVIDTSAPLSANPLPDIGYPGYFPADNDPNNDQDTVDGGAGNDIIITGDDADTIIGGSGNDTIDAGFDADTIDGGSGDDVIIGGEGSDNIDGGSGHDIIYGGLDPAYPDSLNIPDSQDLAPNNGQDVIHGGAGNDIIYGQDDNDMLFGDAGNDILDGGIDDDVIDGGLGDDTILASIGDDVVIGGDGTDTFDSTNTASPSGTPRGVDVAVSDAGDGSAELLGLNGQTVAAQSLESVERFVAGEEAGAHPDTITLQTVVTDVADIQNLDDTASGVFTPDNGTGAIAFGPGTGTVLSQILNNPGHKGSYTITSGDESGQIGNIAFENFETINFKVICFTPNTAILTSRGEVLVQDLREGDLVVTRDNGMQPVRWIGRKKVQAMDLMRQPELRPVLIKAGSLGGGLPLRDMMVSPAHRMLLVNHETDMLFGEHEVLVAAKHLTKRAGVMRAEVTNTEYIHFMCDQHEVVLANGSWSESFQPGEYALGTLENDQREELFKLFPELRHEGKLCSFPSARTTLKKHEVALLP